MLGRPSWTSTNYANKFLLILRLTLSAINVTLPVASIAGEEYSPYMGNACKKKFIDYPICNLCLLKRWFQMSPCSMFFFFGCVFLDRVLDDISSGCWEQVLNDVPYTLSESCHHWWTFEARTARTCCQHCGYLATHRVLLEEHREGGRKGVLGYSIIPLFCLFLEEVLLQFAFSCFEENYWQVQLRGRDS